MKIIFSCLGFATSEVFLVKDGRQLNIGTVFERFHDEYEFWLHDFWIGRYLTKDEIPTEEQIFAEYKKQYAEKGVEINNEIVYAG